MDTNSLLSNVSASAIASILSKLATHPLDTIVVQSQTSTRRPLLSISPRQYYQGIGVVLSTVTPATAVYLTAREAAHTALLERLGDGAVNDALSGCIAELTGSFLYTPMEVLKARLQISSSATESKLTHHLRHITRTEGFRGFYRGYTMGLASYIPYNIIWWMMYGKVKRGLEKDSKMNDTVIVSISAAIAAATGAGFIHPLELVKTRFQVATSGTISAMSASTTSAASGASSIVGNTKVSRGTDKDGLMSVVRNVMKEKGLKGFYAGFLPAILKSIPSAIIIMGVFEKLKADVKDAKDVREDTL